MRVIIGNLFRILIFAIPTLLVYFALEYRWTWLQILVVVVTVIATPLFVLPSLIALRAPKPARTSLLMNGLWITMAMIFLTSVFCSISAVLYAHGLAKLTGPPMKNGLGASWHYYLWNLASAIPFFEIPETLRWPMGRTFSDRVSGILLLLYKLLVLVPLAKLLLVTIKRWFDESLHTLEDDSNKVTWFGNISPEEMKAHLESKKRNP